MEVLRRNYITAGVVRELAKKYGDVASWIYLSVSLVSTSGLYVAIKNNVDVKPMVEKIGAKPSYADLIEKKLTFRLQFPRTDGGTVDGPEAAKKRYRTAEMAFSSGGALSLAIILNRALYPVRLPIVVALTPALTRLLARRGIVKNLV